MTAKTPYAEIDGYETIRLSRQAGRHGPAAGGAAHVAAPVTGGGEG
jgi:hypothetical protein